MPETNFEVVISTWSIDEIFRRRREEKEKRSTFPIQVFEAISYWPPDVLNPEGAIDKYNIREEKIDPQAVQLIRDLREEPTLKIWLGRIGVSNDTGFDRLVVVSNPKTKYNLFKELEKVDVKLTNAYGWYINAKQVKGMSVVNSTHRRWLILKKEITASSVIFKNGRERQLPENPASEAEFMENIKATRPQSKGEQNFATCDT